MAQGQQLSSSHNQQHPGLYASEASIYMFCNLKLRLHRVFLANDLKNVSISKVRYVMKQGNLSYFCIGQIGLLSVDLNLAQRYHQRIVRILIVEQLS